MKISNSLAPPNDAKIGELRVWTPGMEPNPPHRYILLPPDPNTSLIQQHWSVWKLTGRKHKMWLLVSDHFQSQAEADARCESMKS
jgi:hypothetical protein